MAVTNIVFDMDDTLYMERDYVRSGFIAVAEMIEQIEPRLRVTELVTFMLNRFKDYPDDRGTIFDRVIKEFNLEGSRGSMYMVNVYRNQQPNISLAGEVVKGLNALREQGRFLGIITDGDAARQYAKHQALGLDVWVPYYRVIINSACVFMKPYSLSFREMAQRAAGPFVYVGDNPSKDFKAPHRLGWTTVRLLHPDQLHRELPSNDDVTAHAEGWEALFTYLQNLP